MDHHQANITKTLETLKIKMLVRAPAAPAFERICSILRQYIDYSSVLGMRASGKAQT